MLTWLRPVLFGSEDSCYSICFVSTRQKMKEDLAQLTVSVPIKDLWKAMSTDIRHVGPKVLPDIVAEVELLEGDGGYGSMLLFKFCPDLPKVRHQLEKIVEYDDSVYQIGLELLEGGYLDHGFTSYTTAFKLTQVSEAETLIDVKVLYETKPGHNHIPEETIKAALHYLNSLEKYMLKHLS
ncbi:hypothetical protein L1987_79942 [Smallanthus sonchifolius]|uniref:Uncharacterized protein n=1 Tax=Smallanthus sonchifolius TaxID=185202 RepID=A0ACB8YMD0_9ASTR|nr:hypothetical protein L1987_79942 [Smallanthus sonchifolius]